MKYEIGHVTPKLAEKLLSGNTHNRPLRQQHVDFFVDLLKRGAFQTTHQGVAISTEGRLLDGQHRLMAIFMSGIPADMWIATDCDEDTYIAMDVRAAPRSVADVLQIDKRIAYVANFILRLHTGNTRSAPDQVRLALDYIGSQIHKLMEAKPGERARVTAAPIRAAVVLRMLDMPINGDRLCGWYKAFAERTYDKLPPSLQALLKQVDSGSAGTDGLEIAARAWRAFDPERVSVGRVQIKDRDVALEEMRMLTRRVFPRSAALRAAKTRSRSEGVRAAA